MEHIEHYITLAMRSIKPFGREPIYKADGSRVFSRLGWPHWLELDGAEREGAKLAEALFQADDPGEILPLVNQLAWAIRDAREVDNDPQPPAAANAIPTDHNIERAA